MENFLINTAKAKLRQSLVIYITANLLLFFSWAKLAQSQIVPDSTLPNSSNVLNQGNRFTIEGGTAVGNNLFHSFQQFNIENGLAAYFKNPQGILNIFSRVTGKNSSNINGVLGVLGNANLFFLNPNGIIFGPNARLDIKGAFVASTVDRFLFNNNQSFSATNPQAPPLLTINVPIGLQQGMAQSAIQIQGANLNLPNTLSLVGTDINLQNAQIQANEININSNNLNLTGSQLQSVSGAIRINTNQATTLGQQSLISNELNPIFINTASLNLQAGSRIQTVTQTSVASGNIEINATGNIEVSGFTADGLFSGILTYSATKNSGESGKITINNPSGSLNLADRGFIATVTNSNSNSGEIQVNAANLQFRSGGQILTLTTGAGKAGDITVAVRETANLNGISTDFVTNPFTGITTYQISADNFTNTANPNVESAETIPYISVSRTPTQIVLGATVFGAAIAAYDYYEFATNQPDTQVIFDIDGGRKTDFRFDPGNIDTQIFLFDRTTGAAIANNDDSPTTNGAGGSTSRQDSYISTTLKEPGTYILGVGAFRTTLGDDAPLEGKPAQLGDSYTLNISVANPGNPSAINSTNNFNPSNFNPNQQVNSGIFSLSQSAGNTGNLYLNTHSLNLSNGARIATNIYGSGNIGNMNIVASQIDLVGVSTNGRFSSGIFSQVRPGASGNGGLLTIETDSLGVRDRAEINANTFGSKPESTGSNLLIDASQNIELVNTSPGGIIARINDRGNGGQLTLNTRRLLIQEATISNDTQSSGRTGEITINASERVELRGASSRNTNIPTAGIFSLSRLMGDSGDITVNTGELLMRSGVGVRIANANTGTGKGGNITINARNQIEIAGGDSFEGNGLFANSSSGLGDAGNIRITTNKLILRDGGLLTANNFQIGSSVSTQAGRGNSQAGNVDIQANSVLLDRNAQIAVAAISGERGNLTINAQTVRLQNRSQITVEAQGTASGGNININSNILAALQNSIITANALQGQGGNIQITTQGIFLSPNSQITASSQLGVSGIVSINSPEVQPSTTLVELTSQLPDLAGKIIVGCARPGENTFTVTGRGGLPESPSMPFRSEEIWQDLTDYSAGLSPRESEPQKPAPWSREERKPQIIVEATNWRKNSQGQIELFSNTREGENNYTQNLPSSCVIQNN
ncbi:filamentous hemagglutinin N-terminal domain-containing protein [Floridanema evergladense]